MGSAAALVSQLRRSLLHELVSESPGGSLGLNPSPVDFVGNGGRRNNAGPVEGLSAAAQASPSAPSARQSRTKRPCCLSQAATVTPTCSSVSVNRPTYVATVRLRTRGDSGCGSPTEATGSGTWHRTMGPISPWKRGLCFGAFALLGSVARDGVEPPLAGDALQLGDASLLELEPGSGDKVLDRARDEDVARLGLLGDPGADVDGDSADLAIQELAL